jgi:hypothetical protein
LGDRATVSDIFRKEEQLRKVVYTCVVDGYDRIRAPLFAEPSVDYIVFSDNPDELAAAPWQLRPIIRRERNPRMTARWHKLHPHLLFPDHELSLYVDSNIVLRAPVTPLAERMLAETPIALFRHPERDCPYAEADVVMRHRLDDGVIVEMQMAYYRAKSYRAKAGLHYSGVLLRRHNDLRLIAFHDDWWRQLKVFSHRDQLSLDFMLQRHGIVAADFSGFAAESPWLALAPHRRYRVHFPDDQPIESGDELDWLRMVLIAEAQGRPRTTTLPATLQSLRWNLMEPLRAIKRVALRLTWRPPVAASAGAKADASPEE